MQLSCTHQSLLYVSSKSMIASWLVALKTQCPRQLTEEISVLGHIRQTYRLASQFLANHISDVLLHVQRQPV